MKDKKFIITEDMVKKAHDSIPVTRMEAIARSVALNCLKKSETAEQNVKGLEFLSLPCMWVDDLISKKLYLMKIFLSEYLKIDTPEEFNDELYDYYAGSHIFNQLERFKKHPELKNKVFDMLDDYSILKTFVNTEIANEKSVRNDPVARISAAIAISTDPENLKKMQEQLMKTADEFQVAQSRVKAELMEKGEG